MNVEKEDLKKCLRTWYFLLDEYNDWDNKEFKEILKKYNLKLEDIFKKEEI